MKRALALVALVACGGAPKEVSSLARDEPRAALTYGIQGSTKPSPVPLVRGTIRGRSTLFVVDTGAQSTVVAAWLADALDIEPNAQTVVGVDAQGAKLATRAASNVALTVDGLGELPDRGVLIIDLPPILRSWGVGGILAVQNYATAEQAIVIDFPSGELRRAPKAKEEAPRGKGWHDLGPLRSCTVAAGNLGARSLLAEATVDGVATTMALDTGSGHSSVLSESAAGRKIRERKDGRPGDATVAGGSTAIVRFDGVPMQIGAHSSPVNLSLGDGAAEKNCPHDGLLGMPELRSCVLVIGATDAKASCAP